MTKAMHDEFYDIWTPLFTAIVGGLSASITDSFTPAVAAREATRLADAAFTEWKRVQTERDAPPAPQEAQTRTTPKML